MTTPSEEDVTPESVLTFWLGASPLEKQELWWKKDAALDAEIRERFGTAIEEGAAGKLEAWRATPRGRLALVILLDQFSRNAFRGTPRAFAQDPLARDLALEALGKGDAAVHHPVVATFLFMPLMHAEDVTMQEDCVRGFAELCTRLEKGEEGHDTLQSGLTFAEAHAAIVKRFGRFPHRNDILGRPTTDEEKDFLTKPGSSF